MNRTTKNQPCPDVFHMEYDWMYYYYPQVYYCYSQNTLNFYGINQNYLHDTFEVSIADLQQKQEYEAFSQFLPSYYSKQFANVSITEKTVTMKIPLDGDHQGDKRKIYFANLGDYGILFSNLTIAEI